MSAFLFKYGFINNLARMHMLNHLDGMFTGSFKGVKEMKKLDLRLYMREKSRVDLSAIIA